MFLRVALVALIPAFAVAADPKLPLPAKMLEDGWVALFDGKSTFGWKVSDGVAVKDGVLTLPAKATITFGVPLPPGKISAYEVGEEGDDEHPGGPLTLTAAAKPRGIKLLLFKPTGTKPIFNGKDLTGWSVFQDEKRAKSKWAVTPTGELHLTNGPGDLQTAAKYGDFVLQLECKTGGKNLNSGVFFRCIDKEYQNGYEMQIHNGFKDGDRTKPSDGGSGAIYRRVPAREVVANDEEWFHMTLIAHGPTFATFVNGYPVANWTDERPKDDNPRKGLRLAAGHLSIQGHDPTTDLLFRNIRAAEFPKAK